jgi:uncharacterized membrane protein YgcG
MTILYIIIGIVLFLLALRFGLLGLFFEILFAILSGGKSGGSGSSGFGGGDSGGGGASSDY